MSPDSCHRQSPRRRLVGGAVDRGPPPDRLQHQKVRGLRLVQPGQQLVHHPHPALRRDHQVRPPLGRPTTPSAPAAPRPATTPWSPRTCPYARACCARRPVPAARPPPAVVPARGEMHHHTRVPDPPAHRGRPRGRGVPHQQITGPQQLRQLPERVMRHLGTPRHQQPYGVPVQPRPGPRCSAATRAAGPSGTRTRVLSAPPRPAPPRPGPEQPQPRGSLRRVPPAPGRTT